MTTFKLDTKLADHLEQEIYEKLTSAVDLGAKEYNADWKAREARGEKFETYEEYRWGKTKTKKSPYAFFMRWGAPRGRMKNAQPPP